MIEEITYRLLENHRDLKKGTKFKREWNHVLMSCYRFLSFEERTEVEKFAIDERIRRRDKYYSFLDETKTCEIYLDYLYDLGRVEKITRRKNER